MIELVRCRADSDPRGNWSGRSRFDNVEDALRWPQARDRWFSPLMHDDINSTIDSLYSDSAMKSSN